MPLAQLSPGRGTEQSGMILSSLLTQPSSADFKPENAKWITINPDDERKMDIYKVRCDLSLTPAYDIGHNTPADSFRVDCEQGRSV